MGEGEVGRAVEIEIDLTDVIATARQLLIVETVAVGELAGARFGDRFEVAVAAGKRERLTVELNRQTRREGPIEPQGEAEVPLLDFGEYVVSRIRHAASGYPLGGITLPTVVQSEATVEQRGRPERDVWAESEPLSTGSDSMARVRPHGQ